MVVGCVAIPNKLVEEKKSNEKKEKLETRLFYQHQSPSNEDREDQLKQEQEQKHREIAAQLELQQKQAALEQEIARLNLSLQQQQQLNQQQKELFLRHQEQVRLRNNERPFLPIVNPSFGQFNTQGPILNQKASLTTEKPGVNQFNSNLIVPSVNQPLPVKSAQVFNQNSDQSRNSVTLHPSITFNPLIEAGKLPPNAQILPVKGPINFHTPIIQTPGFQQFHSLSNVGPTPLVNNFNQLQTVQPQFNVIDNQGNRFFRQEFGVGNFLNNDVNKVSPSFSIQKSVAPPQQLLPGFNNFHIIGSFLQHFLTNYQKQSSSKILRPKLDTDCYWTGQLLLIVCKPSERAAKTNLISLLL
ncbi:hypothetical protein NQ318_012761 [Aromia moschata]|uniref:Uncharacterized protein n=1 Tax=Aromia moschata TaxID=1265417 RepID=A0AAV8YIK6_9CUCU|nr:hypothetical protein NQ318_012761 [Aromia moschata]